MSFLRLKLLIASLTLTLCAARIIVAILFLVFGDWLAFLITIISLGFTLGTIGTTYFVGKYNIPRRVYLHLKNIVRAQKHPSGAVHKLYKTCYYYLLKFRLYDSAKFKHVLWVCFEIEVLSMAIIFVLLRGWGYGFELFLIVPITFFYLNFRYKNNHVHIVPFFFLTIFLLLFLLANHVDGQPGQLWIYIANGSFTLLCIFVIQIVCAIGRVIKTINDNNRYDYLKSLSSYDALTNTLHKYSFLDVASARLEHSPEEDLISQASVILIEFSNLPTINKQYGLQIGDVVLREFAHLVKVYSENYDCYLSRWSGNEFLIFLLNEDEKLAHLLAEQISKEAAFNRFSIKGIRINAKYGIASSLKFNYELGDLIDLATAELKHQKELDEKDN